MNRILSNEIDRYVGKTVTIAGWVNSKRNHGKIAFLDIRDIKGVVQVVVLPGSEHFNLFEKLSIESCVRIDGEVIARPDKLINNKITSGKVEIRAHNLVVYSLSKELPFEIGNSRNVNEDLRLKYRYLDLRNSKMKENIIARSNIYKFVIDYLINLGFTYIQTPLLSKSTPEGARDFLIPSRLHKHKFFALPQSPQQYKQLLMIAGFEKYFQIAPCFRDEDARADRSPGEFYQIDIEMSFVDQDDIIELVEKMYLELITKHFPEKKITLKPFPRLSHEFTLKNYGTDKPDLRKNTNDPDELAFSWVTDFPLFSKQSQTDYFHGSGNSEYAPSHHMFTAPRDEDLKLLDSNPAKVRSLQHDLVLNGVEIGGGSIRIHSGEIQNKIWNLIGFSEEQKSQFSHLIEAFQYGVPPHGGIAPGFDRFISLVCNEKNIREVIAFPLNGDARDPLMDSPSTVKDDQLKELKIKLR